MALDKDLPWRTISLSPLNNHDDKAMSTSLEKLKLQYSRQLTQGEKIIIDKVFGVNTINYSLVRIWDAEYLPFGLQNDDTTIAPNGNIYFPKNNYKKDFSDLNIANASDTHHFVHEMTHVWQFQLGYSVRLQGAFLHPKCKLSGHDPYAYILDQNKTLTNYNMEQQGNIIADYYSYYFSIHNPAKLTTWGKNTSKGLYLSTLRDFLKNPTSKVNLPK